MAEGGGASMRPQRNAAENIEVRGKSSAQCPASMRPQRNAAENLDILAKHCMQFPLQ